jgi:hypothetical protein
MTRGDFAAARDHFNRELRRQPYQDEVHFWAAQAHWRLGDAERAAHHLRLARDYSVTRAGHARYAAKLDSPARPLNARPKGVNNSARPDFIVAIG